MQNKVSTNSKVAKALKFRRLHRELCRRQIRRRLAASPHRREAKVSSDRGQLKKPLPLGEVAREARRRDCKKAKGYRKTIPHRLRRSSLYTREPFLVALSRANLSLPPRGRGTALAVEGACATLEFVRALFCTHSPSVALRRQLPLGGSLKLVPLGRANTVRPYDVGVLCGGDLAGRRDADPWHLHLPEGQHHLPEGQPFTLLWRGIPPARGRGGRC